VSAESFACRGAAPDTRGPEVWFGPAVRQATVRCGRGNRDARVVKMARPARLTVAQILRWADAHHERTGGWPRTTTGAVPGAPGEAWLRIDTALRYGHRGLPGGDSLARLLDRERGVPNTRTRPLTEGRVLAWARAHRRRTGSWPTVRSGPVSGVPGELWRNIDQALRDGSRGLRADGSLARLLRNHRNASGQRLRSRPG
jgi:hypothetical protein